MKNERKIDTSRKKAGRFYTPGYIVNNILALSGYEEEKILKKHVIDNSCGDGAFIAEIVDRYCKEAKKAGYSQEEIRKDLSTYIHGIEVEPLELNKCRERAKKVAEHYGIENVEWDLICDDALAVDKYDGTMDFVLGNPPYVRVHNLECSLNAVKKFSFAQKGMTDLFIAFYEIGLRMLNENGILGYITPSSFFNSLAGLCMRKKFVAENLLEKVVDLKHFQAFESTTYTTMVVLRKGKESEEVDYYQFNEENLTSYYVDTLVPGQFFVADNFYFAKCQDLELLRDIYRNKRSCDVSVKNGYATLCDSVFVNEYNFISQFVIPVIKASRGYTKKIFYPYDKTGKIIEETEIQKDEKIYTYLLKNKESLLNRSNDKNAQRYWYAFGRSQAINDTYKNKLSINSLLRTKDDLKFGFAPAGTGVYGGLYIVSDSIDMEAIKMALKSDEFIRYIALLGKYKSGGYYTYSSKDVKKYLDYKLVG